LALLVMASDIPVWHYFTFPKRKTGDGNFSAGYLHLTL
jgi:hypothetical protein